MYFDWIKRHFILAKRTECMWTKRSLSSSDVIRYVITITQPVYFLLVPVSYSVVPQQTLAKQYLLRKNCWLLWQHCGRCRSRAAKVVQLHAVHVSTIILHQWHFIIEIDFFLLGGTSPLHTDSRECFMTAFWLKDVANVMMMMMVIIITITEVSIVVWFQ